MESNIKKYILLQIRQFQFKWVEVFAKERANMIYGALLFVASFIILLFGSIYFSMLLNDRLDSNYLGFGYVFLFWLLILFLIFIFRKMIKRSLFYSYANQNIPE